MSGHSKLMPHARLFGAMVFALSLASAQASAQTMDYGALEQTFGEPVTTSATGAPQRVTDAPVDMIIITAEDIRRSGAHDIPGVLRHAAGVDVLQWTDDDADVSVRGYDQPYSPRLLVLIDGRQVYADYYGFTPWSALPVELSAIRQIEIVKGPNTALFGFNAVGGVVNIVTYNPLYDETNTVSLTGGTQNLVEGTGVLTVHDGNAAALRVTAGGRSDTDFSTPVPVAVAGPPRQDDYRGEIDLNGIVRLNDKVQLGLEASHSVAAQNEIFPGFTFETATIDTDSVKTQLTADTAAGLLQMTAYTNWVDQHAVSTIAGQPVAFLLSNRVTVVQLGDSLVLDADNTIRLAGEYRYNTAGTTPTTGGNIFYNVFSGSAMWAWAITPALSLTNAVRLDDLSLGRDGATPTFYPYTNASWNRSFAETSYNSGLVWRSSEWDTFRAIASRGVQLPNLVNLGALLIATPGPYSVTGTPDISPTTVSNYELGWDHTLDSIAAKLRASVFHQDTSGAVSVAGMEIFTPGGLWVAPANIGNSHADGVETALSGTFDEVWRWGASYRFETIHDRFVPYAQNGADYVDFEHTTPRNLLKLNLGWFDDQWEVDGYVNYQSQMYGLVPGNFATATVEEKIPAYASIDARLGYKLTDALTAALSAQNMLPSRQEQTTGPAVQRRILATLSFVD